ncbi:FecCD family ABC transporter permease [Dermatophilus congolensis]|uniref:FecCD family ABC transporter permease n=1 Tax=Dermatophilus congolensis TaxID=1863 RepID=UPI001AAE94C0|nr:iron ABC transporter permease [Dermatophilus congolensis]MBO3143526.1 iron ABC transporter permease [Dermatophilus congolensis]MBO3152517.1 iron ABC transporter permease [Dermatophilus congolensis]MBO3160472.1 iron ABC transporter permease [Dermatophilus congolensis]MBO3163803.1 iron ABC transporter permease [Dermatophilus congolensis]MBO3177349.1 iron ABC transporter permease [Dermatophilus congolensis]
MSTITDSRLRPGELIWPLPRTRIRVRTVLVCAALGVLVTAMSILTLGQGTYPLTPVEVITALTGNGPEIHHIIVVEWRLPRTLVAVLVGCALGAAGSITQTLARNALASPDLLGITMGSSVAVVTVLALIPGPMLLATGALASIAVPLAALVGGLIAAGVVWLLTLPGGTDTSRLVLTGVGITTLCSATVSAVLASSDVHQASEAVAWLAGTLDGRQWQHAAPAAICLITGLILLTASATAMQVLPLGDDTARSLGVPIGRSQALAWVAAVVMTAGAVAAAGPIGFVALAAPQVARLLLASPTPPAVAGGLCGAVMVPGCDLISQHILAGTVPVGVVTAAAGAPFFIALLVHANKKVTS